MFFYTNNINKIKEAQEILEINIKGIDMELPELQDIDVAKVARYKYEFVKNKKHNDNFIVEDSGLYLCNKEIGALIKFFPNKRIVKAYKNQEATAVCVFVYENNEYVGIVEGKIVEPRGENGFGWDPIFMPDGSKKTFAEMTKIEKNKVSPRRLALNKMKKNIKSS